jgi:hypothetical protein
VGNGAGSAARGGGQEEQSTVNREKAKICSFQKYKQRRQRRKGEAAASGAAGIAGGGGGGDVVGTLEGRLALRFFFPFFDA